MADWISSPGASSDRKVSEFENEETTSVLCVEPTLIALEMHAGAPIPSESPSFPDATTVAIPNDRRLSIAALRADSIVSHSDECGAPPRVMFTEAIGWVSFSDSTCSSALIWSDK